MTLRLCIRTHTEIDLTEFVYGHGMIVAVSDIHLGDKASNRAGFSDFIERYLKPNSEKITELYLLGDILDLWRRDTSAVISDNLEILNSICSLGFHVFYIVGNHDLIMADVSGDGPEGKALAELTHTPASLTICTNHHLTDGKRNFRFIHGHQIDYWYALPFYQAFCRAMCHIHEFHTTRADLWNLVHLFSKDLSPIVAKRIERLSEGARREIERKLAAPLDGYTVSKEESAVVELDLLSQFIEIGGLCPSASDDKSFDAIRREMISLCDDAETLGADLESVQNLSQVAIHGTPEEVVNRFLMTWSDIHRWILELDREGTKLSQRVQLVRHLRRIAAMLTADLRPDEFLIHGHDHHGYVDEGIGVADTGCWTGKKASFITIDNGKVACKRWPLL